MLTVTWQLISGGSALVEHWAAGTPNETETIVHPDHGDLMLTHYCAQGNQPRLRVASVTPEAVVFRFADVTNREPDQDVLVEQTLSSSASGTLDDTEVYARPDGTYDRTTYHFTKG